MSKKDNRLNVLRNIIASKKIRGQNDLLIELDKVGIKLAQATLSRDLKQLKVAKAADASGKYIYVLPSHPLYRRFPSSDAQHDLTLSTGFISINFSGNLAVVHTRPGFASGLAYEIDQSNTYTTIGTLAGDDTILLIMREGVTPEQLIASLQNVIPGISMPENL